MHGDSLGDHTRVDKALMGVGVNEPIHECKGLVSENSPWGRFWKGQTSIRSQDLKARNMRSSWIHMRFVRVPYKIHALGSAMQLPFEIPKAHLSISIGPLQAKVPMNINPMDFYFVEEPKLGGISESMQVKRVEIMSNRHAGPSGEFVCLTNSWTWLGAPIAAFCLIPQYPW
ncbi:hypothetical protein VNO77_27638 [Canavalia gladiata]|uniref:Uncharacterized protein n=1 Tax=Canavalia gladiata TaxID=3824 RepID=A0AAN9KW59_CANGL